MSDKSNTYLVLYSDYLSARFGQIGAFSEDQLNNLCSPGGNTIYLGGHVDFNCRENGFINDPDFTPEDTSRALRNYFENGRYYRDLFNNSRINISYYLEEMETWILRYIDYLKDDDLKEVIAYFKELYDTYGELD